MAATAGNSGNQLAAPMDSAQADMRSWLLSSAKILPKRVDKLLAVLDDEEVDTFDHLRVFAGKIGGACDKLLTETTVGMIRAALACDAGALQVPLSPVPRTPERRLPPMDTSVSIGAARRRAARKSRRRLPRASWTYNRVLRPAEGCSTLRLAWHGTLPRRACRPQRAASSQSERHFGCRRTRCRTRGALTHSCATATLARYGSTSTRGAESFSAQMTTTRPRSTRPAHRHLTRPTQLWSRPTTRPCPPTEAAVAPA